MGNLGKLITTAALSAILFSSSAFAQNGEAVNLGKRIASKNEIINALAPKKADKQGALPTRGLRLWNKDSATGEAVNAAETAEPGTEASQLATVEAVDGAAMVAGGAVSLEIYFAYNSSELSDEAKMQLSPVGEALRSQELDNLSFVLEGHTDASGSSDYNLGLSKRRADSVKSFFVNQYGVDPSRLEAVGRGETHLLDERHPNSEINRRVAIITKQ